MAISDADPGALVARDPASRPPLVASVSAMSARYSSAPHRTSSMPALKRSHLDIAAEAIEAGCHIFVEKPLALSISAARQLLDIARQRPLATTCCVLATAWRRYPP